MQLSSATRHGVVIELEGRPFRIMRRLRRTSRALPYS